MNDKDQPKYRIIFLDDDVPELPLKVETLKKYPAFVIVTAPEETIEALRKQYFVERLKVPTAPPKVPKVMGLSTIVKKRRELAPYIRVVRFTAAVKREWIKKVEATGCTYQRSLASRHIIVRCPDKESRGKLEELAQQDEDIDKVAPYVPTIRLPRALKRLLRESGEADAAHEGAAKSASEHAPDPDTAEVLEGRLEASFFSKKDRDLALRGLRYHGVKDYLKAGETLLLINLSDPHNVARALKVLVARRGLQSLTHGRPEQPHNNLARTIIADRVVNAAPLGLDGNGEIVAVADSGFDTGDMGDVHADFQGRVIDIKSFPVADSQKAALDGSIGFDDGAADLTGHGTHVAGTILGDGTESGLLNPAMDPPVEGVAPGARLVFQAVGQTIRYRGTMALRHTYFGVPDDLQDLFARAYALDAHIHCNSWGRSGRGRYEPRSEAIDKFVWENKDFLVIFSAGNDARGAGNTISRNSIGPQGVAKNALTVGASENRATGRDEVRTFTYEPRWAGNNIPTAFRDDVMTDDINDIAPFSSRGPGRVDPAERKYRIKPDVVAPGTFVLSTRSRQLDDDDRFIINSHPHASGAYMYASGTSMAAPLVAGCAALVRQYLRQHPDKPIPEPSAALMKAMLIHSARYFEYKHARPDSRRWADYEQGWGRVDLQRVLNPSVPVKVLYFEEKAGLETGQRRRYKVKISDTDVPLRATLVYTDAPGVELQCNLNLLAQAPAPSMRRFVGNHFLNDDALDDVNNVEGIIIDPDPAENGIWTIGVVASSVPSDVNVQDFALVISGGGLELLNAA